LLGLGDKIQGSWPVSNKALSIQQVKKIQTLLNTFGYIVGKIDGKIGPKTIKAIHRWQLENNVIGDGYASESLLYKLEESKKIIKERL